MLVDTFNEAGTHYCNLTNNIFDWDEVADLQDTPINRKALYLHSQTIVGNITEPLAEIKRMRKENRAKVFEVWVKVVKDPEELKNIAKYIIRDYVE